MTDDSITSSHSHNDKALERHSVYDNDNKSRKFRWSSCFSFVTKFKKPSKSQKIRLSQSYEEFAAPVEYPIITKSVPATIQVLQVRPGNSIPWKQQPSSSLSPPPRHAKSKRDSTNRHSQQADNTKIGRRPLVDPTLTPRVKPRSIKTKKQPSLLRLSLDADLLQSPDGPLQDDESLYTCKTGHSSNSFTLSNPLQSQPFRSGTLGATDRNTKLSLTDAPPLPLLNIPKNNNRTRPNSQSTTTTSNSNISFADSPVSVEAVTFIDDKLTLKERRQRKSPLSMPDTEQLTLALKELLLSEEEKKKRKSYGDDVWRQQLLEQSIAFSFQNKSRQEAMLILEGKKSTSGISLQPIVNVHELDHHFDGNSKQDVVRDKAQYDAIVSSSAIHKRQLSHDERRNTISNNNRTSLRARSPTDSSTNEKKVLPTEAQQQLGIINENEVATIATPSSTTMAKKMLAGPHLSVIAPETPPHHQQNAPSLISAPSTPNSIDSSVFDHDDYMIHERQNVALALNH